jgi:hypothetical protein
MGIRSSVEHGKSLDEIAQGAGIARVSAIVLRRRRPKDSTRYMTNELNFTYQMMAFTI